MRPNNWFYGAFPGTVLMFENAQVVHAEFSNRYFPNGRDAHDDKSFLTVPT